MHVYTSTESKPRSTKPSLGHSQPGAYLTPVPISGAITHSNAMPLVAPTALPTQMGIGHQFPYERSSVFFPNHITKDGKYENTQTNLEPAVKGDASTKPPPSAKSLPLNCASVALLDGGKGCMTLYHITTGFMPALNKGSLYKCHMAPPLPPLPKESNKHRSGNLYVPLPN